MQFSRSKRHHDWVLLLECLPVLSLRGAAAGLHRTPVVSTAAVTTVPVAAAVVAPPGGRRMLAGPDALLPALLLRPRCILIHTACNETCLRVTPNNSALNPRCLFVGIF